MLNTDTDTATMPHYYLLLRRLQIIRPRLRQLAARRAVDAAAARIPGDRAGRRQADRARRRHRNVQRLDDRLGARREHEHVRRAGLPARGQDALDPQHAPRDLWHPR